MAPKPESSAKLGPLGREFRGVEMAGAYTRELFWQAFKDSLAKFDPRVQIHNPVMFVVWVGTLVTLALTIHPSLFEPSRCELKSRRSFQLAFQAQQRRNCHRLGALKFQA